jgi:hypothetical protein
MTMAEVTMVEVTVATQKEMDIMDNLQTGSDNYNALLICTVSGADIFYCYNNL